MNIRNRITSPLFQKWYFLLMVFFAVFLFFWSHAFNLRVSLRVQEEGILQNGESFALVTRVVDGDTVDLADGRRVRYVGIDAPEIGHAGTRSDCYGEEAKERNIELVEGQEVQLIQDISEKDKYGRWLYIVFIEGVSVEEVLSREGYVREMSIKPDIRYADDIKSWVNEAREQRRGLWGSCESF